MSSWPSTNDRRRSSPLSQQAGHPLSAGRSWGEVQTAFRIFTQPSYPIHSRNSYSPRVTRYDTSETNKDENRIRSQSPEHSATLPWQDPSRWGVRRLADMLDVRLRPEECADFDTRSRSITSGTCHQNHEAPQQIRSSSRVHPRRGRDPGAARGRQAGIVRLPDILRVESRPRGSPCVEGSLVQIKTREHVL